MIRSISKDLSKILGSSSSTSISKSITSHYSKDESYHNPKNPDIITFPKSTSDVSEIHKYCHQHDINIIPFGQGSGFEGGVVPQNANQNLNLTIDMMKHMNKVLKVFPSPDKYAKVEAGVTREQLNDYRVVLD